MNEYKTIYAESTDYSEFKDFISEFDKTVNEIMRFNWEPLGAPIFTNVDDGDPDNYNYILITQTMVR